jgi:hypothetical protein
MALTCTLLQIPCHAASQCSPQCEAGLGCIWVPLPSFTGQGTSLDPLRSAGTWNATCVPCGMGHYKAAGGNTLCTPCNTGSFTAVPQSFLSPPSSAQTSSSSGLASPPSGGAIYQLLQAVQSGVGNVTRIPGHTSASACQPCPSGEYSNVVFNPVDSVLLLIDVQRALLIGDRCPPCAVGTYSASTGVIATKNREGNDEMMGGFA